MQSFVAQDTLKRLAEVNKIPEQEILLSDYFTYTQDYAPEWIAALKAGEPKAFMGSEMIDVWLGAEEGKSLHLKIYLRREYGAWKIYRVRDLTDNFEHPMFNDYAIEKARQESQQ
jgi:hypothetical protein